MKKFERFTGQAVPLDRANVDTDLIIPKQFLKSIKRTGFGPNLFDELRYLDEGQPGMDNSRRPVNPEFILNRPEFENANVLLARKNFGCGSSREHAPWALTDYGFKVVIAPSFADIFYNNSFKNGLLLITLDEKQVDALFEKATNGQLSLDVNLQDQCFTDNQGETYSFEVDPFRKMCLLEGLDDIGMTLQQQDAIKAFEANHFSNFPWLAREMKLGN